MVLTPYTESDRSEGTAETLDFKRIMGCCKIA